MRFRSIPQAAMTLPLLLLVACTGIIAGSGEPAGTSATDPTPGSAIGAGVAGGSSNTPVSVPGTAGGGGVTTPVVVSGPPPAIVLPLTSRVARLSHTQLLNSYRDLLGITDLTSVDATLTPDAVVGFDNEAEALYVNDMLWGNLQQVAETLAHTVATTPTLLAKLVPATAPPDAAGKASAFIAQFGLHAYRRPLTNDETVATLALFNQGTSLIGGTDAFAAGAELVISAVLQAPNFLYRMELGTQAAGDRIPLSDYEAASKLSYALTNTMPDDALFSAAAAGQVANQAGLAAQTARLLATPNATTSVEHFHFQMYRLGVYDGITKDVTRFPNFSAAAGPAMRQENLLFLDWIFRGGKGVADIYSSPVSFVNNLLAPTYGLSGKFTSEFAQTDLDPTQRAGLLTQLGFLAAEATTVDVATILRGAFVNSRILCVSLPAPSPLATPLPAISPGETDRELVDGFTGPGTCAAGCHATMINPPGFAFENYDSVGAYRATDQGKPVNAADSYTFQAPFGKQAFTDGVSFSKLVAKSPDAHGCYVQNWASYLYGRPVADANTGVLLPNDAPFVQYLSAKSLGMGLSVKDLILTLATDDNFLARSSQVN